MPISYTTIPLGSYVTSTSSTTSIMYDAAVPDQSMWSTRAVEEKYKVGDEIIMTSEASVIYGITKKGSRGIIKAIDPSRGSEKYFVEFTHTTGDLRSSDRHYWVTGYFRLAERLTQREKIIRKIQQMDKRRKDQGYVF